MANKGWELTDEERDEILKIYFEDAEDTLIDKPIGDSLAIAIAHAALKKLLEYQIQTKMLSHTIGRPHTMIGECIACRLLAKFGIGEG